MGAAGIAAMTLSRPASRWYALLLAAAATLALNPRACGDPGWQLSFAAVAGILTLGRPLGSAALAGDAGPASAGRGARAERRGRRRRARRRSRRGRRDHRRRHASPPRRCSPTTSGRSRSPACRPTCSRSRPSLRPCGWGWSRRRSASWRRRCRPPAERGAARSVRSRGCPSATRLAGRALRGRARRADRAAARIAGRWWAPTRGSGGAARRWRAPAPRGSAREPRSAAAGWRRRPARAAARGRRGGARRAALPVAPAVLARPGAARRAHGALPRRRPGRRHADPAPRRHGRALRRRSARGAASCACCARRACGGSPLVVATHASRDHHGGLPDVLDALPGRPAARRRRRHARTPVSGRSCARRPRAACAAFRPRRR